MAASDRAGVGSVGATSAVAAPAFDLELPMAERRDQGAAFSPDLLFDWQWTANDSDKLLQGHCLGM